MDGDYCTSVDFVYDVLGFNRLSVPGDHEEACAKSLSRRALRATDLGCLVAGMSRGGIDWGVYCVASVRLLVSSLRGMHTLAVLGFHILRRGGCAGMGPVRGKVG